MNNSYQIKLFSCLRFPVFNPDFSKTDMSLQANFLDIDSEEKAIRKFGIYEIYASKIKTKYKYVLYGDTIRRVTSERAIHECELTLDRKIITTDNKVIAPTGELHGYYGDKDIFIIDNSGNKRKLSGYYSDIQKYINS